MMLVNEDRELTILRRRVGVLEAALAEAIAGLGNGTGLTMGEKHDLILKLSAVYHNPHRL